MNPLKAQVNIVVQRLNTVLCYTSAHMNILYRLSPNAFDRLCVHSVYVRIYQQKEKEAKQTKISV